jgi:hypothetical protein
MAMTMKRLQIIEMIGSPLRFWDFVVNLYQVVPQK